MTGPAPDVADAQVMAVALDRLRAVLESLHYRMTCVDPPPTWDEIVQALSRALDKDPD